MDAIEKQKFDAAIEQLSKPDVFGDLMLASTPEAANKIAESLEPVKTLVQMGTDAGSEILQLLPRKEILENDYLTTAVLYVVWRTQPPDAQKVLGPLIVNGSFRGINTELSGRLFLKYTGIPAPREDVFDVAFREAQRVQNENPHPNSTVDNGSHSSNQDT